MSEQQLRVIPPPEHEHQFNLRVIKPNEIGYHGMVIRWCIRCGKTECAQRDILGHFSPWETICDK